MFDISFSELLVIAVVALIVIGPEKLPKVARTAGAFFGRMQRLIAQVKEEVNREGRFQELQKLQDEVKSGLQHEVSALTDTIAPPALLDAFTDVPSADQSAKHKGVDSMQAQPFSQASVALKKPRKPRVKKVPLVNELPSTQSLPGLEPTVLPVSQAGEITPETTLAKSAPSKKAATPRVRKPAKSSTE